MLALKFVFAALIIVCAVFYILYIGDFSLVLLIVMASVPVIMFVSLLITKKLMSAELAVNTRTASKNEPFDVQLCVSNRSIFPVGKAEAVIEYYNIFNGQINTLEFYFPVLPRNSQRITFQLSSKFCGIIRIRSACITIYDSLRIFKFRLGKNICENIAILPEGHDISGSVSFTDRLNDDSLTYSEYKPGDDPSEVFDLREYAQGDRLSRVHWKLSSKKDELIVKEYSLPVDSPAAVFIDLTCPENSEYTLPLYDTLLESLISISQLLIENERIHTIIYYSAAEKQFVQRTADCADSLAEIVGELLLSLSDDLHTESPELFFAENAGRSWASFTYITAVLSESMISYIDDQVDSDIKNAVVVVKDARSAEALSKPYLSLSMIPVTAGRISSSVRDIEL